MTAPAAARAVSAFRLARHPGDLVRLGLGALLVALTAVAVDPDRVSVHEENLFRLVNDLPMPGWLWLVVGTVMQLGSVLTVPTTALVALAARRWRLAFDFAVAGGTAYLLALAVKDAVQRGRPQQLLEAVHVHGEPATGLGYVSGHAAVAAALATVAAPYLGRRERRAAWALAVTVCVARVWSGAHLPLDVIGGAALGWLAGVIVHLLLGAPGGRPAAAPVQRALEASGLGPVEVRVLGGLDARRAACFHATSSTGPDLLVKVVPRERRDSDLIYRAWRHLAGRGTGGVPAGPPPQQVQHEAVMALMAAAAGVRTPPIVLARAFGNGAGLLAHEWVPGRALGELPGGEVADGTLTDLWRQVAALHAARIAHGDLSCQSVVVDGEGRPWLVDFSHAQAAARPGRLRLDAADLLVALAARFGAARAAAAARAALGAERLAELAAALSAPARLGPAARRELRARPALREELLGCLKPPGRRAEPAARPRTP